jgi:uncharacterized protein YdeI (YjbR/CyaY-like superfamily)
VSPRTPDASSARAFKSRAEFRRWLQRNGEQTPELWIEFATQASGRGGLTYIEAIEESLCFGWIDGVRVKTGPETYANRFTPRKPRSSWSAINLRRFEVLSAAGLIAPQGMRVFEARDAEASGYAIGDRPAELDAWIEAGLRAQPKAWAYFAAQPPHYRRGAAHWVLSAKREETRERRLATLVADSAAGRRFGPYGAATARSTSQKER